MTSGVVSLAPDYLRPGSVPPARATALPLTYMIEPRPGPKRANHHQVVPCVRQHGDAGIIIGVDVSHGERAAGVDQRTVLSRVHDDVGPAGGLRQDPKLESAVIDERVVDRAAEAGTLTNGERSGKFSACSKPVFKC